MDPKTLAVALALVISGGLFFWFGFQTSKKMAIDFLKDSLRHTMGAEERTYVVLQNQLNTLQAERAREIDICNVRHRREADEFRKQIELAKQEAEYRIKRFEEQSREELENLKRQSEMEREREYSIAMEKAKLHQDLYERKAQMEQERWKSQIEMMMRMQEMEKRKRDEHA